MLEESIERLTETINRIANTSTTEDRLAALEAAVFRLQGKTEAIEDKITTPIP